MRQEIKSSIIAAVSFISFSGFIFDNPVDEVEKFIVDTQSRLKASHTANLPPMPLYQEYQPYTYTAGESDPFKLKPFVIDIAVASNPDSQHCDTAECGDAPPIPHSPYFLENFDLTNLKMVGTVKSSRRRLAALVATPDAGVQEIKVGEYIGRNNGLVLSIHPDHIVIQEKYKVPRGWQNRMATLELFN